MRQASEILFLGEYFGIILLLSCSGRGRVEVLKLKPTACLLGAAGVMLLVSGPTSSLDESSSDDRESPSILPE